MTAKLPRRLALTTGILFIAAGAFKLLLAAQGGSTPATDSAFAELLKQLGVPFPGFFAVAVPLVEVIGGSGLALNFAPRLWAAALTGDMAAAIFWSVRRAGEFKSASTPPVAKRGVCRSNYFCWARSCGFWFFRRGVKKSNVGN